MLGAGRRPMAVEFKQDSILDWLLDTQEKSTIRDTAEHGCSGGTISELIYYADTSAFYDKYQTRSFRRLSDMADDLGESPFSISSPPLTVLKMWVSTAAQEPVGLVGGGRCVQGDLYGLGR